MANTLTTLLKKQTIRIDNHHKGVQNVWDNKYDIHLHKQPNNKNVDYDIKINLNHEQNKDVLEQLPSKIRKEVKKATSNPEVLENFYVNVYKYLTENFGWDGNKEDEERIINNIAKSFDIRPFKPRIEVINQKTQKRNVIQMLKQGNIPYHISFNYSKQCIYIGQFQLGDMTGIHTDVQIKWVEVIEENLRYILAAPDTKAALNRIRISGISYNVIEKTLDAIEKIYGNKPDYTDKESK